MHTEIGRDTVKKRFKIQDPTTLILSWKQNDVPEYNDISEAIRNHLINIVTQQIIFHDLDNYSAILTNAIKKKLRENLSTIRIYKEQQLYSYHPTKRDTKLYREAIENQINTLNESNNHLLQSVIRHSEYQKIWKPLIQKMHTHVKEWSIVEMYHTAREFMQSHVHTIFSQETVHLIAICLHCHRHVRKPLRWIFYYFDNLSQAHALSLMSLEERVEYRMIYLQKRDQWDQQEREEMSRQYWSIDFAKIYTFLQTPSIQQLYINDRLNNSTFIQYMRSDECTLNERHQLKQYKKDAEKAFIVNHTRDTLDLLRAVQTMNHEIHAYYDRTFQDENSPDNFLMSTDPWHGIARWPGVAFWWKDIIEHCTISHYVSEHPTWKNAVIILEDDLAQADEYNKQLTWKWTIITEHTNITEYLQNDANQFFLLDLEQTGHPEGWIHALESLIKHRENNPSSNEIRIHLRSMNHKVINGIEYGKHKALWQRAENCNIVITTSGKWTKYSQQWFL
jgi:hypothetical protein